MILLFFRGGQKGRKLVYYIYICKPCLAQSDLTIVKHSADEQPLVGLRSPRANGASRNEPVACWNPSHHASAQHQHLKSKEIYVVCLKKMKRHQMKYYLRYNMMMKYLAMWLTFQVNMSKQMIYEDAECHF